MDDSHPGKIVPLANQATSLASDLYKAQQGCQNKVISVEISTIAEELTKLSATLWQLNDAINKDRPQYTQAFDEDLQEILGELKAVFEEILECCEGLQAVDCDISTLSWFFKRGRVARLLKHLEALEGTLLVMRIVLGHGRDYGLQTSSRIAESEPHVLREDRLILESVLIRNKDAIADLRSLTNTISGNGSDPKQHAKSDSRAGDHHRQLSASTNVDIPPVPDVLPPSVAEQVDDHLVKRTFTKRGVPHLHMSILDLGTHEASDKLREKWIRQAHGRLQVCRNKNENGRTWPIPLELSRISEVDTAAGSRSNLDRISSEAPLGDQTRAESDHKGYTRDETPVKAIIAPASTPVREANSTTPKLWSSRFSSLRRALSRISITNDGRTPTKIRHRSRSNQQSMTNDLDAIESLKEDAGKSEQNTNDKVNLDFIDKADELASAQPSPRSLRKQKSFLETVKQKFQTSPGPCGH